MQYSFQSYGSSKKSYEGKNLLGLVDIIKNLSELLFGYERVPCFDIKIVWLLPMINQSPNAPCLAVMERKNGVVSSKSCHFLPYFSNELRHICCVCMISLCDSCDFLNHWPDSGQFDEDKCL